MNKIKSKIGGILFALSFVMLSFQLIIETYEIDIIVVTSMVSFFCALYFWQKTIQGTFEEAKNHKIYSLFFAILACIVWSRLYSIRGVELRKEYAEVFAINPFRLRFFILSIVSIIYIGIFLGNKIKKWMRDLYHSMDVWDKKAYIITSLIWFSVILIFYNLSSNWYLQYDKVYSLDSGWCFSKIFPKSDYYDIRHPLLSIFTFPIFAIVDTIVKVLFYGDLTEKVEAIILQYVNIQFLILIGLQLKLLTKNRLTYMMYMLSFPTILFSMFFEKYQICVFLLCMYVFEICRGNKETSEKFLISAAGCMPTSCFIGVGELIAEGKWKEKLFRILKIVIATLLIFICLGRTHTLKYGLTEVFSMQSKFSNKTFTIKEKMISTTKMIQSSFVALPSTAEETKYWWNSLETQISLIAFAIMVVIMIGIIKHRKEIFVKISAIWCLFAFILFVILNWSTHESPLFALYFSWSIIPLFVMGLDFMIEKIKMNKKIVYGILFGLMLVINIATILDIQRFLFLM